MISAAVIKAAPVLSFSRMMLSNSFSLSVIVVKSPLIFKQSECVF